MGFWLCSDFINNWKTCATLTTRCIKINTRLSVRYSLIQLYLAVEAIPIFPLNAGRVRSVLRKYSFRLSNCSISFTKTLSRLIHREVQCFFKCLDNMPVISDTFAKSSLLAAKYLKKKSKSIAIWWSSTISSSSFTNLLNPWLAEWRQHVPRSIKVVWYFSFSYLIRRFWKATLTPEPSIRRFSNNLISIFCLAINAFKRLKCLKLNIFQPIKSQKDFYYFLSYFKVWIFFHGF